MTVDKILGLKSNALEAFGRMIVCFVGMFAFVESDAHEGLAYLLNFM